MQSCGTIVSQDSRSTIAVAIGLVVLAVLVLVGLLHPRSIQALERAAERP